MNRALITGLSFVLLVLTSTPAHAVEGAQNVVVVFEHTFDERYKRLIYTAYGVAWNFKTRWESVEAAHAECIKIASSGKCGSASGVYWNGPGTCLIIRAKEHRDWGYTYWGYNIENNETEKAWERSNRSKAGGLRKSKLEEMICG